MWTAEMLLLIDIAPGMHRKCAHAVPPAPFARIREEVQLRAGDFFSTISPIAGNDFCVALVLCGTRGQCRSWVSKHRAFYLQKFVSFTSSLTFLYGAGNGACSRFRLPGQALSVAPPGPEVACGLGFDGRIGNGSVGHCCAPCWPEDVDSDFKKAMSFTSSS